MTTLEAFELILKAIKDRFSMKNHKHDITEVSGLSTVAKTGRYVDLSGTPTIPTVTLARQNRAGIVMPGNGMMVNETGSLNINVDTNSGLVIENNTLKIKTNLNYLYTLEYESWIEMYDEIVEIVDENVGKGVFDFNINLTNTYKGKSIVLKLNRSRIENLSNIRDYVVNVLTYSTDFPKTDEFAQSNGFAKDTNDLIYYELYRIMSTEETIDAVELYLYGKILDNFGFDSIERLGKYLSDKVGVLDTKDRYEALGLPMVDYCNNVIVTYVLKGEEYGPMLSDMFGYVITPYTDDSITAPEISNCTLTHTTMNNLYVTVQDKPLSDIAIFEFNNFSNVVAEFDILNDVGNNIMQFDIDFSSINTGDYIVRIIDTDNPNKEKYYKVTKKINS